jgi:N-methylhydantoinase B
VNGGQSGMGNRFTVLRDGAEVEPSTVPGKVTAFPLERGDVVWLRSAGGGGYGDPLDRAPALVLEDVSQGYISVEHARERYGVVIADGCVSDALTRQERNNLRGRRCRLTIRIEPADWFARHRRVCPISASTAELYGISDGQLVEVACATGAPLRAWVKISPLAPEGLLPIGPMGAAVLNVKDDDQVYLRPITTPYAHPPLDDDGGRRGFDDRIGRPTPLGREPP